MNHPYFRNWFTINKSRDMVDVVLKWYTTYYAITCNAMISPALAIYPDGYSTRYSHYTEPTCGTSMVWDIQLLDLQYVRPIVCGLKVCETYTIGPSVQDTHTYNNNIVISIMSVCYHIYIYSVKSHNCYVWISLKYNTWFTCSLDINKYK